MFMMTPTKFTYENILNYVPKKREGVGKKGVCPKFAIFNQNTFFILKLDKHPPHYKYIL